LQSSFEADNAVDNAVDDSDSDILHVEQQPKRTTPSQDAMLEHMAYLQMNQRIPWVCWRDFKELNLSHGTIRNNLFKLKEMGYIEYSHKSKDAYYTLPKDSLQNVMTVNHLWVTKHDLAALINRLAFDTPAAHNIRLKFHCPKIYNRLKHTAAVILDGSGDAVLPRETIEKNTIEAGITIHQNDVVSISLACSTHPIYFDIPGLVRLTSSLSRLEERLRFLCSNLIDIPYSGAWVVTMWHIGIDSKERYTGPAHEETWDTITGEMYRIYSKMIESEKKRVLRLERQEYPNNPVHDAVEQILSRVLGGGAPTTAGGGGVVVAANRKELRAGGGV
jgi:hypothetical protein